MHVTNLMTQHPASICSDESLSAAAQVMWDCDCGVVPVLDRSSKKVVGMITDRDICMATWSHGAAPSAINVVDAMSTDLISCAPQDTVAQAEALMRSHQIRRVPVVDREQRLVGILSLADIARATEPRTPPNIDSQPSSDGLTSTLAAICRQHSSRALAATA